MNILAFCVSVNTTYTTIWKISDIQWKYSKSFYEEQYLYPRAVLPAPLRFIYYFAKFVRYLKQRTSHTSDQEEQYSKYSDKLRQIVKSKIHFDFENSLQDNFSDMKQDIQNFVSEKQKETLSEMKNLKELIEKTVLHRWELRETKISNLRIEWFSF